MTRSLTRVVQLALEEDAPWGDVTSDAFVSEAAMLTAAFVARETMVFVGVDVIREVYQQVDTGVTLDVRIRDGFRAEPGAVLATIRGSARSVLRGERVALNLVQRLSATATLTRRYVDAVAHTGARIVDTRKTTPGLRELEKYAVRCGGGRNHRFSLSDAAMVKDNHLATLSGDGLTAALQAGRALLPHTVHFEVEVDTLEQLPAVLACDPDTVLLDNFSVEDLAAGVRMVDGSCLVEASGGVTLATVASIAETGVDLISVGALTHSAGSVDIGLDVRP